MRRHPLILFFALAFALPWAVWGTSIAEAAGWIGWHLPPALAFWIGLPIATFGTAAVTGGWPAVKDLLLRMVRWRVAPLWYAAAILITPLLAVAAMLLGGALGTPALTGPFSLPAVAGALAFNVWMWLLTEEVAWRGFALPRMEQRMRPLTAALLLGALWALWHLPLWFVPGSFQASLPLAGFVVSTVATSVLLAWVFDRARGSVLIAALFHGVTDVTIGLTGVMTSGATLFWIFVGLQVLAAAACAPAMLRRRGRVAVTRPEPVAGR
jgi:membrane protease YdiL (CAAX protease family)